ALEPVPASPADLRRLAAEVATRRRQLLEALVVATGQTPEVIAHELEAGDLHDAAAAVSLGLIDRVIGPPGPHETSESVETALSAALRTTAIGHGVWCKQRRLTEPSRRPA